MECDHLTHDVYPVDDWVRLHRFLIMGSEGSCYHASDRLLQGTVECIERLVKDGAVVQVLQHILDVSVNGSAPKQSFALYALAKVCEMGDDARRMAFACIPFVCRTFSSLALFLSFHKKLSWGRNTRNAIGAWIREQSTSELAYQFTKYRNRNGYRPRDLLRLCHIDPNTCPQHQEVLQYVASGVTSMDYLLAAEEVKTSSDKHLVIQKIKEHRFQWEHIGKQCLLKDPDVWNALLVNIPANAFLRNLSRMIDVGVNQTTLISKLKCPEWAEWFRKARVHPINILAARVMLNKKMNIDSHLLSTLDECMIQYMSSQPKSCKRILVALDVSGSMHQNRCIGMDCLDAMTAAGAIAMTLAHTEPFVHFVAFSHKLVPLHISHDAQLHNVLSEMTRIPMGTTDCAAPMIYASNTNVVYDCFIVITDNETNSHQLPPYKALLEYRKQVNPHAQLAVLAMSTNDISIAKPDDRDTLDIVGLDASMFDILHRFMTKTI